MVANNGLKANDCPLITEQEIVKPYLEKLKVKLKDIEKNLNVYERIGLQIATAEINKLLTDKENEEHS